MRFLQYLNETIQKTDIYLPREEIGTIAGWKKVLGYKLMPQEDSKYWYHSTFEDYVPEILIHGLMATSTETFIGYSTKQSPHKQVCLTTTVKDLEYWSTAAFYARYTKERIFIRPVLLRILKTAVDVI